MSTPDTDEEENEPRLSEREAHEVADHRNLSSVAVYAVVRAEGVEELRRPASSLWWSGVAAGVGISSSVLAEGILHEVFEGHPRRVAVENLGYTVGFVLVILSRLQLFTENTITAILPLLDSPRLRVFLRTARLWAIVFAANMVGTFLTAFVTLRIGTAPPEYIAAMLSISHHFAENTAWQAFALGIPAGFFIAAIVWMLPSSRGSEIFVIVLFTYLIAMGDFTHVIAGSAEVFMLVLDGQLGWIDGGLRLIVPTFIGNVAGGTGLFALLAYGQVKEELRAGAQRPVPPSS